MVLQTENQERKQGRKHTWKIREGKEENREVERTTTRKKKKNDENRKRTTVFNISNSVRSGTNNSGNDIKRKTKPNEGGKVWEKEKTASHDTGALHRRRSRKRTYIDKRVGTEGGRGLVGSFLQFTSLSLRISAIIDPTSHNSLYLFVSCVVLLRDSLFFSSSSFFLVHASSWRTNKARRKQYYDTIPVQGE
jgi:hypothetical protein